MTRKRTADPEIVSNRLKQLRKGKGIKTQSELHEKTGISLVSIKRYESGATIPEDPNLEILAKFYRVDPNWILGKTDYKSIWEEYNSLHEEDLKRIRTELSFLGSAEALGFFHPDLDESDYEEYIHYNQLYEERKKNMKTRSDVTVVVGSAENRIIENFVTGEITIQAVSEEDVERGFQHLIQIGIIADQ